VVSRGRLRSKAQTLSPRYRGRRDESAQFKVWLLSETIRLPFSLSADFHRVSYVLVLVKMHSDEHVKTIRS
jgi:hypothetical protein